jgi:hypothetical protein
MWSITKNTGTSTEVSRFLLARYSRLKCLLAELGFFDRRGVDDH